MGEHDMPAGSAPAAGQSIVGRSTAIRALTGFVTGAVIGAALGSAFGFGILHIPYIEFFVAGGAGVPAFLGAVFGGAALGLAGALRGTIDEASGHSQRAHEEGARQADAAHDGGVSVAMPSHAMQQGTPGTGEHSGKLAASLKHLPIYGSVAVAVLMGYTLVLIAMRALGAGAPSDQSNRVTWNEKNVTRIGGTSGGGTQAAVLATAYPATRPDNRPSTVIVVPDDWRIALAATPLIARPSNFALVVGSADTGHIAGVLRRLAAPVRPFSEVTDGPTSDPAGVAAAVAAAVDRRIIPATGSGSRGVIVVSADADPRWALPAGAYAARTGTPILFVSTNAVPSATVQALRRRGRQSAIYVLGPERAVSNGVVEQLGRLGRVVRIAGRDYATNAVRFAEFYDEQTHFGWGRTGRSSRRFASSNSILVNRDDWRGAITAAHLAHRGKSGPLLFTGRDRLPAAVAYHLWRQRPAFANTPAEGPFSHVWVVGNFDEISYPVQARADYAVEIEQYMTLGDSATSGLESLAIGWILLCVASATWMVVHGRLRLPDVMPTMRGAWVIFALLLGPIAVWLYITSYHRRPKMQHGGMTMWQRPAWGRAVSATVMMFGFDMILMVLAVFLLAYRGFPIAQFNGPLFWAGTAMFLMMAGMYLIALVVMLLVFHTPMTMHEKGIPSYWRALLAGAPVMIATMTVESIGMMPTMWWAQMSFLPGMQMPTDDDMTMWATLLMSVAVAFLIVLPFNYWMVRRGSKQGTM